MLTVLSFQTTSPFTVRQKGKKIRQKEKAKRKGKRQKAKGKSLEGVRQKGGGLNPDPLLPNSIALLLRRSLIPVIQMAPSL